MSSSFTFDYYHYSKGLCGIFILRDKYNVREWVWFPDQGPVETNAFFVHGGNLEQQVGFKYKNFLKHFTLSYRGDR